MRIVYLTLAFFMMLGIAATCRTPAVIAGGCDPESAGPDACEKRPDARP